MTYLLCLWDVETLVLIVPPGGERPLDARLQFAALRPQRANQRALPVADGAGVVAAAGPGGVAGWPAGRAGPGGGRGGGGAREQGIGDCFLNELSRPVNGCTTAVILLLKS